MCGICGVVSNSVEEFYPTIESILQVQNSRGPDDNHITKVDNNVLFGHTRLSIIDMKAGVQPMVSKCKKYFITYNGEIYNYKKLKDELKSLNVEFTTDSDTEIILNGFIHWGIDILLEKLDGMFAFSIFDSEKNSIYLVRDKHGQKPLYYSNIGGNFGFTSTMSGILEFSFVSKNINSSSLETYFTLRYIPAPETIYSDINKVNIGSYVTYCNGDISETEYYNSFHYNQNYSDKKGISTNFKSNLISSVEDILVSDVPVSLMLSSGLDSLSIAIVLSRYLDKKDMGSFTVGFNNKKYDESVLASKSAKILGLKHSVITFEDNDLDNNLDNFLNSLDEPFGDPSIIPTMMLSEKISQHTKVAIGGDGGDELFAGYPTFQAIKYLRYYNYLPKLVRDLLNRRNFNLNGDYYSAKEKMDRFLYGANEDENLIYYRWLSIYKSVELKNLLKNNYVNFGENKFISDFNKISSSEKGYQMSSLYLKYFFQGILEKTDKASMTYSLESRTPFLQNSMVDFALSIPFEEKLKKGKTKSIVRNFVSEHLPKDIWAAKKMGFMPPLSKIVDSRFKEIESLLENSSIDVNKLLNMDEIRDMLNKFKNGNRGLSQKIWLVFVFLKFMEKRG